MVEGADASVLLGQGVGHVDRQQHMQLMARGFAEAADGFEDAAAARRAINGDQYRAVHGDGTHSEYKEQAFLKKRAAG
ncbi:hypothetical protein D3C79_1012150 [compost metagenome]